MILNAVPFPADVPPHETEYQFQTAPVPKVPPVLVIVEDEPLQIVDGVALIDVAAIEFVFKLTVTLLHVVVLHVPSALTK